MNEIRIPLDQYAYINVKFDGTPDETLAEYRRLITLSKTPENTSNLQPVPFLRILYKYMVENRLELEDIEALGTEKLYSQKDVVNLIKNVFAKITREEGGLRADSSHRQ